MHAPNMSAFQSLHLCKTMRILSSRSPYSIITCYESRIFSRLPKRFHSTPHPRFPSSTAADESTLPSWTAFPNLPPPPPVNSLPPQTPTVHDPTTSRVVARLDHNGSNELSSDTEKAENTFSSSSAFPSSPPQPVPVDSLPRQTSSVQTVYDVTTGRLVTKRVHNGSKEVDAGTEEAENIFSTEVGTKVYGDVIGSSSVRSRVDTDISSSKKMGSRIYPNVIRSSSARSRMGKKIRNVYVCSSCGYSDGQWWGSCRECGVVGTMTQFTTESADQKTNGMQVSENAMRSWLPKEASPIKLNDVYSRINDTKWRMSLTGKLGAEVERVLGGGLVPGSLVLVGGDPGVGKSTLLLQIVALIGEGNDAHTPGPVIYVSGEESVEQIANRADRLCIETENLFLYSSTDIEEIIEQAQRLSPKALVIDSIQTVYLKGVTGSAGGLSQVKECTSALLKFAKKTNIPVLLIGHVTKTGEIAGPRVLEHIVDVVLYLEGEKYSSHRLLRSVKNRFGPSDELGVFKMSQLGLEEVLNPSEMYLAEEHSDSDYPAGLAVTVIVDGSRAFLIEVQALCGAGSSAERPGSLVVRHLNGVQASRADMIISAIIKQAGLKLQANDIFLNVVNGVTLTETAGDLAIAAAVCSSFLEFPLPNGIAFVAEVGLAGELRMVPQLEKRINTLGKLGYKKCIVPKSAEKSLHELQPEGMEIVGCKNLKEMINTVFRIN